MNMRVFSPILYIISFLSINVFSSENLLQERVAPTGLLITGIGIGTVWTLDLISQKNINMNGSIFKARDKSTNQLIWPHLVAEYSTATVSIISAVGLYNNKNWAKPLSLIASGLVAYTSVNSMSWVLSEKGRYAYAIPMMIGLTSAGITIGAVF